MFDIRPYVLHYSVHTTVEAVMHPGMTPLGLCALLVLTVTRIGGAQPLPDSSERVKLDAAAQLVREERVAGSAWPRVTIRQFVAAAPLEAAAVFADYPRHATYLPGVRSASISKQVNGAVAEVDYLLDVPLFPDEAYTVRDSISVTDNGAGYCVDWVMVRARSTRAIRGSARFQPYRNSRSGVDGTLITYENLVTPGQAFAGPLKGRALAQVRQTVTSLVAEIERVRRDQPALLASQTEALLRAVGSRR